jgi:hypothetical protein
LSADEFHDLGTSIRRYLDEHPSPRAVPALLSVYEIGFCSYCRTSIVEDLISLASLPDAVVREIVWDCAEDTRMLAVPFRLPDGE